MAWRGTAQAETVDHLPLPFVVSGCDGTRYEGSHKTNFNHTGAQIKSDILRNGECPNAIPGKMRDNPQACLLYLRICGRQHAFGDYKVLSEFTEAKNGAGAVLEIFEPGFNMPEAPLNMTNEFNLHLKP